MEKRAFLAVLLSTIVLAGWYYAFPPPEPNPATSSTQPPASQSSTPSIATPAAANQLPSVNPTSGEASSIAENPTQVQERRIRVQSPYWRVTFSNRGGVATNWTILKNHAGQGPQREMRASDGGELELIPQSREMLDKLGAPLELVTADESVNKILKTTPYVVSDAGDVVQLGESDQRELIFSLRVQDIEVQKKFVFRGNRFDFEYSVEARRGGHPLDVQTILGPSFGDQSMIAPGSYVAGPHIVADVAGKVQRIEALKPSTNELNGQINWVSDDDNYFALTFVPRGSINKVAIRTAEQDLNVKGQTLKRHFIAAVAPTPAGQVHTIFVGPKDPEILDDLGTRVGKTSLDHLINYGFISSVTKPLVKGFFLPIFNYTYKFIPNYGVVIILITFVINMLFFPLKWKGAAKMKKAQAMQPKMKELQDKMKRIKKDDPQLKELQMEQVRLMREANPFGGCLPMLVQLPFFFAIYSLLTSSIDVRQAPFVGWINNLSAPDQVTLLGFELHVLPILMCLAWIAQTYVMPMPAAASNDPSQATQQKIQKVMMGLLMPVAMTVFFFWKAPSGLVLYWMFNNVVATGQQVVINRMTQSQPEQKKTGDAASEGKQTPKPAPIN